MDSIENKRGKELFFEEHFYGHYDFKPKYCQGDIFKHKESCAMLILVKFSFPHKVIYRWINGNEEHVIEFEDLRDNYEFVRSIYDKTNEI